MISLSTMKAWLPVITGVSALCAALLSAAVSLHTQDQQNRLKIQVESAKDTVARARLFNELIEKLKDPESAAYALLTLWQIYSEDHRKTVVLAAIQRPNENSMNMLVRLGLQDELKQQLPTLAREIAKGTGESQRAARKILSEIAPREAAQALVKIISEQAFINLESENVRDLITLARTVPETRTEISSGIIGPDKRALMLYILYEAGDKEPLKIFLRELHKEPARFGQLAELLFWGNAALAEEDWQQLVSTAVKVLGRGSEIDDAANIAALRALLSADVQSLPTAVRTNMEKEVLHIFLTTEDDLNRGDAFNILSKFSTEYALLAVGTAKICKIPLSPLDDLSATELLGRPEVGQAFPELPAASADAQTWQGWIANRNLEVQQCSV